MATVPESGDFDIPKSLLTRMYEDCDRVRNAAFGADGDMLELVALMKAGVTNAEEIARRPRGEMKFVDDLLSDAERQELWPFEVEKLEATLEAQMARDESGCLCRTNADGRAEASNTTIRWVNDRVSEWAIGQMDQKYVRMDDQTFCALSGDESMPKGSRGWKLDDTTHFIMQDSDGAWNARTYLFLMWDGKDKRFPLATFDSFPNRKEAAAAMCLICDAAAINNTVAMKWRHQADRLDMKPSVLRVMLEKAAAADVPAAPHNLKVLLDHMPELKAE